MESQHFMKPLLTCFFWLFTLSAQAQIQTPTSEPVTQFTLGNGMQVIIQPERRAPTAVHMLWVRVGAMDEVDGVSGVAHVLEHMMFKGTPALAPGEFSRRVAELGGRDVGDTDHMVTETLIRGMYQYWREVMEQEE